jgi:hypothetical protein
MAACVNREAFPHGGKTAWGGNADAQHTESACVAHAYTAYVNDDCRYTWGLSPLVEMTPYSLVFGKEVSPEACSAKKQCSLPGGESLSCHQVPLDMKGSLTCCLLHCFAHELMSTLRGRGELMTQSVLCPVGPV